MPLKVKLLNNLATPPTIAHPGEDLGYDVYAPIQLGQPRNEDGTPVTYKEPTANYPNRIDTATGKAVKPIRLEGGRTTVVDTGIAVHFEGPDELNGSAEKDEAPKKKFGLLVRDRSSLAKRGIYVTAGVVDAGYRGELKIIFNIGAGSYQDIWPGDKIAQIIPYPVHADTVEVVDSLEVSAREEGGFGSSGQ